jgi:hypothetical protein
MIAMAREIGRSSEMAQRPVGKPTPKSIFSLEAGEELDAILAEGFPIYQDGVEIDRFFPLKQPPIDDGGLSPSMRRALDMAGAWSDLDLDETEAVRERIDHERKPPPLVEFDW